MNDGRTLDRKVVVPQLLGDVSDCLIVAGLAGTAKDTGAHTANAANLFALGGAMGGALSMGLGLALAQPERRVLVVTGDGELLMNASSLATVGVMQPPNLAILCVDNGHYGETGYQQSHTSRGVDLETIAKGSGIAATRTIASAEDDIADAARLLRMSNGPAFVLLKVTAERPPANKRSFDAVAAKVDFRRALFGQA